MTKVESIDSKNMICVGQLRAEFCCPITHELLKDPVVAADGYTYDRASIQNWLEHHHTSPKTGEKLTHIQLTPNVNLKRLILNFITEGGVELYEINDSTGNVKINTTKHKEYPPIEFNPKIEQQEDISVIKVPKTTLNHVKIATFTCIGPKNSTWFSKSFQVSEVGAIGGRKRPSNLGKRAFVSFMETIVSKTHFEVIFDEKSGCFGIQDLGTSGGTFFRLASGDSFALRNGTIFLIGKHQLISLFPNPEKNLKVENNFNQNEPGKMEEQSLNKDNETLVHDHLRRSTLDNSMHEIIEPFSSLSHRFNRDDDLVNDRFEGKSFEENSNNPINIQIQCIAPEKSLFEGKLFNIDENGATLGRKLENTISFTRFDSRELAPEFDNAISGWHAKIGFNSQKKNFFLSDGIDSRPSTNGTWIRLSRPNVKSEVKQLFDRIEILIGVIWFRVQITDIGIEAKFNPDNNFL